MSILIKGMEMPTSCYKCPLRRRDGMDIVCPVAHERFSVADVNILDYRLDNCPLVPVPEPHGRLIESVELYGRAEDIKTKAMSVCDKPQSWQFGVFWAIEQIEAALTNAPTIIPAEEGET